MSVEQQAVDLARAAIHAGADPEDVVDALQETIAFVDDFEPDHVDELRETDPAALRSVRRLVEETDHICPRCGRETTHKWRESQDARENYFCNPVTGCGYGWSTTGF